DKDASRPGAATYLQITLLPIFQAKGYRTARLSNPQPKAVGETAVDTEAPVQLTAVPGVQYKISDIKWEGNKAFPADKLQNFVHAKIGDLANAPKLKSELEEVHKIYTTRGYMMAKVKPEPNLDDQHA